MVHTLRLDNYSTTPRKLVLGTNSSFGTESIKIERGAGWDGLNLTATWHIPGREEPLRVALLDGDAMDVPPEVTKEAKDGVLVLAGLASGVQRASCNVEYLILEQAGVYGGADAEPTPELAAQVLEATMQAKANAEAAAQDASESKANANKAQKAAENAAAYAAKAWPYAEAALAAKEAAEAASNNAQAAARAAKASETAAAESASNSAAYAAKAASAAKKAADESVATNIAAIEKMQADVASKQTATAASEKAAAASAASAKTSEDAAAKSAADADSTANSIKDSMAQISENKEAVSQLKEDLVTLDTRLSDLDGVIGFNWILHSSISIVDGEVVIHTSANKRICSYVNFSAGDTFYLTDYTDGRFYVYRHTDSGWVADNKGKWVTEGVFTASVTERYLIVVDHLTTRTISSIEELSVLVRLFHFPNEKSRNDEQDIKIEAIELKNAEQDARLDALSNKIPSYWDNEITTSINSIRSNNLTIGANGVGFFFITDTHWKTNAKKSALLLDKLSKECEIPLVVFGGDAIKTYNQSKDGSIEELVKFYNDFNKSFDFMATIGNHDNNAQSNTDTSTYLTNDELYSLMLRSTEKNCINTPNLRCGYIDNESQKVRYIQFEKMFPSTIADGVIDWVDERIKELPIGWTVVLFSHECFEGKNTDGTPKIVGGSATQAKHFGSLDCDATIACWICGHCHYDGSIIYKNMLIISTQTDNLTMSTQYGGAEMTIGTDTEQAFDCFQIDTLNRKIYATRIGAGNDREWTY